MNASPSIIASRTIALKLGEVFRLALIETTLHSTIGSSRKLGQRDRDHRKAPYPVPPAENTGCLGVWKVGGIASAAQRVGLQEERHHLDGALS
jgi:hypothetical protein